MSAANDVYEEKHTAVLRLLVDLIDLADAHRRQQRKQPADWGYVGDLAEVETRLKELVGFLRPGADEDDSD